MRRPGDAQVSVQRGEERGFLARARGGLREDKGRSRSKNSIISADARTSLGFPGADNGALFEESFCARPRCPVYSLFPVFLLTHPFPLFARSLALLFSHSRISHSFYRMKIQSSSRTKRKHNYGWKMMTVGGFIAAPGNRQKEGL